MYGPIEPDSDGYVLERAPSARGRPTVLREGSNTLALWRHGRSVLQFPYTEYMDSQTLKQGRGRPSKYKDEYPDLLLGYFGEYLKSPSRQEIVEKTTKYYPTGSVKETYEKYKSVARGVPTLFGFALKHGISYRTLLRWSKERVGPKPPKGDADKRPLKYPDFCHAYKLVEDFQKEYINIVGMSGAAPSIFAIFAAKNMVGWRDSYDQRFVNKDGKDVPATSIVILPRRLTSEEAQKEYADPDQPADVVAA